MNTIKQLFSSKKFWVTLLSAAGALAAASTGAIGWGQFAQYLVTITSVYVGAQGVADVGKYLRAAEVDDAIKRLREMVAENDDFIDGKIAEREGVK